MQHVNPVTGRPSPGPHGGDQQRPRRSRAQGPRVEDFYDAAALEDEVRRENVKTRQARRAARKHEEENVALEWWERSALKASPGGRRADAPPRDERSDAPPPQDRDEIATLRDEIAALSGALASSSRSAGGADAPPPRAERSAPPPSSRNIDPNGRTEGQRSALRREHAVLVARDRDARAARLRREREDERLEDERRRREASTFLPSHVARRGRGRSSGGGPRSLGRPLGHRPPSASSADAASPEARPARDARGRAPPPSPRTPRGAGRDPAEADSPLARHLQDALAAAMLKIDRLTDELGRFKRHFGPLPGARRR